MIKSQAMFHISPMDPSPLPRLRRKVFHLLNECEKDTHSIVFSLLNSGMPVFRQNPEFMPWQFIFRPYVSVFCVQIEQFQIVFRPTHVFLLATLAKLHETSVYVLIMNLKQTIDNSEHLFFVNLSSTFLLTQISTCVHPKCFKDTYD